MEKKEVKLTEKNYRKNAIQEWNRLAKDSFHQIEFNTIMKFLKK
jgi:hypothetical protein